jgi:hypothetical protein
MNKLIVAVLAVVAVGCAHGPKPEGRANPQVLSRLKGIQAHGPGSGVVVLYRNTVFANMFGPLPFNGTLWIDDQAAGDVQDDKYNVIELPAGRHSFRVSGVSTGILIPMQATTIVTVEGGKTKFLELHSVQEFNNVRVTFQPGGSLEAIAVDCTLGFDLNLAQDTASAPVAAPSGSTRM